MVKLPKKSYEWALKHLLKEGDTDLFPTPFEIQAIRSNWMPILARLRRLDLLNYSWHRGRRFVIPKDERAFRTATQLDPFDSLILAAIIYKHGNKIEGSRVPKNENIVFSNRFNPLNDGRFYGESTGWKPFWNHSERKARRSTYKWVVRLDIADYYNQIYHHTLENELNDSGVPRNVTKAILNLIKKQTHKVSRGIPVGPHSTHLLAECALNPIDKSLKSKGYDFCRYVDDYHFFCRTKTAAENVIYDFAEILDKQQRLIIQNKKTRVVPTEEFAELAREMADDQPRNEEERAIIELIREYVDDDPYAFVSIEPLSDKELGNISVEALTALFNIYMDEDPKNYQRIGWLFRRIAQIGTPNAINFAMQNLKDLQPVLGSAARYVMHASHNYDGNLPAEGRKILSALKQPIVRRNPYLQTILSNLFAEIHDLNNVDALTTIYTELSPEAQREIILAVGLPGNGHWVRERKDDFGNASPWTRRAIIRAASSLPGDEGEIWIKHIRGEMSGLEKIVAHWALNLTPLNENQLNIAS